MLESQEHTKLGCNELDGNMPWLCKALNKVNIESCGKNALYEHYVIQPNGHRAHR